MVSKVTDLISIIKSEMQIYQLKDQINQETDFTDDQRELIELCVDESPAKYHATTNFVLQSANSGIDLLLTGAKGFIEESNLSDLEEDLSLNVSNYQDSENNFNIKQVKELNLGLTYNQKTVQAIKRSNQNLMKGVFGESFSYGSIVGYLQKGGVIDIKINDKENSSLGNFKKIATRIVDELKKGTEGDSGLTKATRNSLLAKVTKDKEDNYHISLKSNFGNKVSVDLGSYERFGLNPGDFSLDGNFALDNLYQNSDLFCGVSGDESTFTFEGKSMRALLELCGNNFAAASKYLSEAKLLSDDNSSSTLNDLVSFYGSLSNEVIPGLVEKARSEIYHNLNSCDLGLGTVFAFLGDGARKEYNQRAKGRHPKESEEVVGGAVAFGIMNQLQASTPGLKFLTDGPLGVIGNKYIGVEKSGPGNEIQLTGGLIGISPNGLGVHSGVPVIFQNGIGDKTYFEQTQRENARTVGEIFGVDPICVLVKPGRETGVQQVRGKPNELVVYFDGRDINSLAYNLSNKRANL